MIFSKVKNVCAIALPEWRGDALYMHPFEMSAPKLPYFLERWAETLKSMIRESPIKSGLAYLTIDEKEIPKGEAHRRGGAHVDGNYFVNKWDTGGGGSGWLTGVPGKMLSPEEHARRFTAPTGGMLIASSFSSCKAWPGSFRGAPGLGGDCESMRPQFTEEVRLEANRLYWMNSTGVHQSLPVEEATRRSLIRITLPATANDL